MRKTLLISTLFLCATLCMAQHDNLPIEDVNGQACYRYEVQKSEGLYRISKTFGVSQEDIIKYNPKLQTEGLKYGQTIYIPVTSANAAATAATTAATATAAAATTTFSSAATTSATTTTATTPKQETTTEPAKAETTTETAKTETQYITHVVQPKETFYGLSHQYGVTIAAIQEANPKVVSTGLQIGQKIRIPKTVVTKTQSTAATETKPATKVTLATPQEIRKAETVKAEEPKVIETTAVETPVAKEEPKAEETTTEVKTEEPAVKEEPAAVETPVIKTEETPVVKHHISAIPLRIAYMLPFMAESVKRDASSDRFVDFYEGSLIAIYEAQEEGQTFDIYTYDVQKTDVAVQQVLQRGELQMADAIIGPAYAGQVTYAGMFAKQNKIPMLIPFTSKVTGIEHNPYMLQFNPTSDAEADAIAHSLMGRRDSVRFVMVDVDAADAALSAKAMLQTARDSGFQVVNTTISAIINDSLESSLDANRENILVFNTEKYASVQVLMKKVARWCGLYRMTLFGHYSWADEKTVLPMIYATVFHTLNVSKAQAYESLYTRYFGHDHASEQPRYDLLGYDITRSMIEALQTEQSAKKYKDAAYTRTYDGLQSDITFRRISSDGGLVNTNISVYRK